jgi:hypothetical protein
MPELTKPLNELARVMQFSISSRRFHAVQRPYTGHARLWDHARGGSLGSSWACSSMVYGWQANG